MDLHMFNTEDETQRICKMDSDRNPMKASDLPLGNRTGLGLKSVFLTPHHEGLLAEYTYTVISIEYSTV